MKKRIAPLLSGLVFSLAAGIFSVPAQPVAAQTSCDTSSNYGTITKSVQAPVTSTYTAWVRLWVPSGASSSVKLSANTICKDLPGASTVGAGSWVWVNKAKDNSTLQTSLTQGNSYTVVVSGQASGVRVDRVLLLSDTCTPTGTGDNCTVTDTTAPTISISSPSNGQTVNGNVNVQFSISDTGDTDQVELLVNGNTVATSTTAPFNVTWDSRSVSDGAHTLGARLTDNDGNTSVANNMTINVANSVDGTNTSRIPVEAYKDGGEGVGYHDNTAGNNGDCTLRNDDVDMKASASGCTLGWFQTGEWLEYDINVAAAGNYTFQVNAASGDADGGKFRLELDGNDISGDVQIPTTGSYDSFTIVSKTVSLPAGQHSLRFLNTEQYYDTAWLQFVGPGVVSIGDVVVPPPQDDVVSRVAVDGYNAGGEGVGYHDTTPGNNGDGQCRNDDVDLKAATNGCTLGWFATGEWLEYDVDISQAGTYTFQVNAARGETNAGAFRLEVDGSNASGRVDVPSTGSWDEYTSVNTEVELPSGEHTLRFFNEQQHFDVAWLQFVGPGTVTLTSTPPPPPAEDETPPSAPANLKTTSVSQTSVSMAWDESVDSGSGVAGYAVYRDSQLLEVILGTGYTDNNLLSDSTYRYEVSAVDAAGNESSKTALTVKTEAEPQPPSDDPSADLNGDGAFTVSDLGIYKTLYKSGDLQADFNGDGELTVSDWGIFLGAWKEGR